MSFYMKNFLFVSCACAYVCRVHPRVCVSVCGVSEVGRAGMYQCVIVLSCLHTVHRARVHHVYLRGWGGEGTEKRTDNREVPHYVKLSNFTLVGGKNP